MTKSKRNHELMLTIWNRIKPLIDKWLPVFELDHWHTQFQFIGSQKEMRRLATPTPAGFDPIMFVRKDWRYRRMEIFVNSQMVSRMEDHEIEASLVHEFLHVILDELRESDTEPNQNRRDREEHVVSWLTSVFVRLDATINPTSDVVVEIADGLVEAVPHASSNGTQPEEEMASDG